MITVDPNTAVSKRSIIETWLPGVQVLRPYRMGWLPRDLAASLVLSALLGPQDMANAELAGLPAVNGLYTTVVCLLAYAAFGPSPYLVLGPDSSLGPMIAATILSLAAGDERAGYLTYLRPISAQIFNSPPVRKQTAPRQYQPQNSTAESRSTVLQFFDDHIYDDSLYLTQCTYSRCLWFYNHLSNDHRCDSDRSQLAAPVVLQRIAANAMRAGS